MESVSLDRTNLILIWVNKGLAISIKDIKKVTMISVLTKTVNQFNILLFTGMSFQMSILGIWVYF